MSSEITNEPCTWSVAVAKEFRIPGCLVEINALGYAEQLWVYNADIVDAWVKQEVTLN